MIPGRVRSTLVYTVLYDSVSEEMKVSFNNGNQYIYHRVPLDIYIGIIKGPSVGHQLNCIKYIFKYTRVRCINLH